MLKNQASPHYHYSFRSVDREGWTKHRVDDLADLDRHFRGRPGDFLVMNIPAGEGWEKPCPFLGVPVPDLPFPFKNRLAAAAEASVESSPAEVLP